MKSNSSAREGIVRQRRPFWSADDVVGRHPLPLEDQVGLGDGVGLGVDLLADTGGWRPSGPREVSCLSVSSATVSMPPVPIAPSYSTVGARGDLVGDGLEHQPGHEAHRVTRGPVLAGLFVVLLVEAAHELFEDRAHAVVVQACG
jgi:hypothetical protein